MKLVEMDNSSFEGLWENIYHGKRNNNFMFNFKKATIVYIRGLVTCQDVSLFARESNSSYC